LHAANVVRVGLRLVAFDCMEFEPAFRWIDIAEEIAFLLADLDARQYPRHARAFLDGYLVQSGDYQACRLLSLYETHRALVRAKVTALSQTGSGVASPDDTGRLRHRAYLDCARRALARKRPSLVLVSGLSGSGKTWLADRLAPALGAVHLRSDVERKRLAGLAEHSRSGAPVGEGMYSEHSTAQVYERLVGAAEDVLAGGYTAIVDATFARREGRDLFRALARRSGVTACLIHCRASHEALVSRIVDRDLSRKDASEADVAVLDWQTKHWEPVVTDEQWTEITVETANVDLDDLSRRIATFKG
jgi:predicted kinase